MTQADPSAVDYTLIDSADALTTWATSVNPSQPMFVDTEFHRESTYFPELCLVQVCHLGRTIVIDPIAFDAAPGLRALFGHSDQRKVFHAAGQDLEVLHRDIGQLPAPLFDTQSAASLLGWGDQIGYGSLVERAVGVALPKAYTRQDWRKRPLPDGALRYAAADVVYLAQAFEVIQSELSALGRQHWLDTEFSDMVDPARFEQRSADAWKRAKGLRKLRPAQRQAGGRLAIWREDTAIARNLPRRWVLKDDVLIDLARRRPDTVEALRQVRGVDDKLAKRDGAAMLAALNGDQTIAGLEEVPKRVLTQPQEPIVDLLQAVLKTCCLDAEISPAAVTSRDELSRLVAGERALPVLGGWRNTVAGAALLDVVEGRTCVRATPDSLCIDQRQHATGDP